MKIISKKQWGIAGVSLGSVLIIVALLTMVGIGTEDTYAASVTECICNKGTYDPSMNKCVKTSTTTKYVCKTTTCQLNTGYQMGSVSGCSPVGAVGVDLYICKTTTTSTSTCACPEGSTLNSSGDCVSNPTPTTCPKGKYRSGGTCVACPSGSYCPGDNKSYSCPNHATCTASDFTCNGGYQDDGTGTACTAKCKQGEYLKDGECVACPNDYPYSLDDFSICYNCSDAGLTLRYPNEPAPKGKACKWCEANHYCPAGVLSEMFACPANSTSPASTADNRIASIEQCICDPGYYRENDECKICPKGSWCADQKQTQCESGTTKSTGAKSIDECGTWSNPGSGTDNPGGGTDNPGGGTDNPGSGTDNPGGGTDNPGGGTDNPGGGTDNPGSSTGNTGSNNNPGPSSADTNPSTATKTPLTIAIVGIISVVVGTFTYFKSKKEQNNET